MLQICYRAQGTGLPRIAERVRRAMALRYANTSRLFVIKNYRGVASFVCDIAEHMGSQIFFRGHYSGAEVDVVEALLEPGQVFVDAGANQGEFTIAAALCGAQVHAFEPTSIYQARLHQQIQLNPNLSIEVYGYGLADQPGQTTLYTAEGVFADGTENGGLSTQFPHHSVNKIIAQVELKRLDDVGLTQVDMIKVDVEGGEWAVLKGAQQLLARCKPKVLFEANAATFAAAGYDTTALLAWLSEQDYRWLAITARGLIEYDETIDFANLIAWHPDDAQCTIIEQMRAR